MGPILPIASISMMGCVFRDVAAIAHTKVHANGADADPQGVLIALAGNAVLDAVSRTAIHKMR